MRSSLVNKPKTKRGEKTLKKIIASAEKNFYEQGYYNTSIINITQGAEVGLGTFYVYFEDKLSLYQYILLDYSHQIRKHIAIAIEDLTDRKEKERVGLKTFLTFIRDNPHIYNIIWESLHIDRELFRDYYENFALFYEKSLEKSVSNGELKPMDEKVGSYILMGIANFIGLKYVMFDEDSDLDKVVDDVIQILEQGLFT